MLVFMVVVAVPFIAAAQTPPAQESAPQTSPPEPEQQVPPFPTPAPGRPPATPGTPPGTTLPPWTPPTPPPPSQTNVPAAVPGAPGLLPQLTTPGAFRPTIATVRGATLEFHPTLRLAEEFSDNFFKTSSGAEDNFRTILGPGFSLLLNGARTAGSLLTTVDLVHDTAPGSGDDPKVFPSLNLALRYLASPRLTLSVADTFVRSDDSQAADEFGIRRGRQTFSTNAFTVSADWLLDQVATQAYYRNVLFFNEDDGNAGNRANTSRDSITHILGLNAATRVASVYIVRAGYEFSRTDRTDATSATTNTDDDEDTTSHTVFGAFSRQFGLYATGGVSSSYQFQTTEDTRVFNASVFGSYGLPTGLSLSAAVGYSILTSDERDHEGTVSARVAASYRFARAVISVGMFQDFRQTAQQGEDFGTVETRSYFGSFLYQLTPFINSVLSVTYSENKPTGTGNRRSSETEQTLTYGASVNWQVLRWLTASLQYTYTKQSGDRAFNQGAFGGSGDYAENRAILNLFATF